MVAEPHTKRFEGRQEFALPGVQPRKLVDKDDFLPVFVNVFQEFLQFGKSLQPVRRRFLHVCAIFLQGEVEVLELRLLGFLVKSRDLEIVRVVEELLDEEGLPDAAATINDDELRLLGVAVFFQLADFILTPDKEVLVHNDCFSGAKIKKISYQTQVRKHCFFYGFSHPSFTCMLEKQVNSGAETILKHTVSAPEFYIMLFPNLLQRPRLRIDDESSHHDVLRDERVRPDGLDGFADGGRGVLEAL